MVETLMDLRNVREVVVRHVGYLDAMDLEAAIAKEIEAIFAAAINNRPNNNQ